MSYVATFFSHFGALCFARALEEEGLAREMTPVPRVLSSNCGTSVRFSCEGDPTRFGEEDVEAIYRQDGETFCLVRDFR